MAETEENLETNLEIWNEVTIKFNHNVKLGYENYQEEREKARKPTNIILNNKNVEKRQY